MKKKLNKKTKIIIGVLLLLLIVGIVLLVIPKKKEEPVKKKEPKKEEKVEEPVDIINIDSKTRPLSVAINNTPVAVKVQTGLNKAYLVYELPTEGSTSRLLAFYKDAPNTKVGTVRSARHNFLDYSYESDAIFSCYGWSHYAQDEMNKGMIDFVQGMIGQGGMWRENPEHLASEHTVYANTDTVLNYAYNNKGYKKESDNTILLNYNGTDIDLSKMDGVKTANTVTIVYGNIVTKFIYDSNNKMYKRNVNGVDAKDYFTKEQFDTKNIIVERITYSMASDNYYWDLHTTGSGEGYFITNGYAVPIKWSKESRKAKTKYTYIDGKEIEVSDGRTYIEVQVTNKQTTIE